LKDDQGNKWKSSAHYGKKIVVLYFYLGDFMPGCTKQARAYRDDLARIAARGAEVVGISGDSPANHDTFKRTFQLKQTLLSDWDGEVARSFGMSISGGGKYKYKDSAGKVTLFERGATAGRWTWVVGKDGKVIYKKIDADPAEDSKQVLALLEKLESEK
jgi:peroxiredoxin Q/BCP